MAWSATALGTASSGTDLTAYPTGSYTPTANRLLVAILGGRDPGEVWAAPTLAGNGVTWELIVEGASATDTGIALFAAKSGGSPSPGALTATFADGQNGCNISVFEIDGADLSGTVTAAFIQAKYDATGGPASSFSITLDSAPAASSRCVAGFSIHTGNVALTPRTNWTEIHDIGHAAPNDHLESEWRSDASEQTASASTTDASNQSWRGLVAEIAEAVAVVPVTVTSVPTDTIADTPISLVDAAQAFTVLPPVAGIDVDVVIPEVTTHQFVGVDVAIASTLPAAAQTSETEMTVQAWMG